MHSNSIYEEYQEKLDKLQYKYRVEILDRVAHYLYISYKKEIQLVNTSEHAAMELIKMRILYQHHYVLGF